MAIFECTRCGRIIEVPSDDRSYNAREISCRCGGKMLRSFEDQPNEMRDIDDELGMDR